MDESVDTLTAHSVQPPEIVPDDSDRIPASTRAPIDALDLAVSSSTPASSSKSPAKQSKGKTRGGQPAEDDPPSSPELSAMSPTTRRRHIKNRLMRVSRSDALPTFEFPMSGARSQANQRQDSCSVHLHITLSRTEVMSVTKETFRLQILYAVAAVICNIMVFGVIFSVLEGWAYFDGVYYSYCTLSTIGYGDLTLKRIESRSLLIWHIFLGVASITYLSSMIG